MRRRTETGRAFRGAAVAVAALAAGLAPAAIAPAAADDREFPDTYFYYDGEGPGRDAYDAMTGQPRPPLHADGWINGAPTDDDLKGKVLVVDLWATWCGPCLAAIPENNAMADRYADRGVVVLGICTSSSGQEKLDAVVEERGIRYPVARDPDERTSEAWHVVYYPTYAVVDREGAVRAIGLKPEHVEDVVRAVLGEPADPAAPVPDAPTPGDH